MTLTNTIQGISNQPKEKEWLNRLVENIEKERDEDKNIAFKITGIKDKGFVIKISGLYGFVSFNYMPWKYADVDS